jgi:hypothetical protein
MCIADDHIFITIILQKNLSLLVVVYNDHFWNEGITQRSSEDTIPDVQSYSIPDVASNKYTNSGTY